MAKTEGSENEGKKSKLPRILLLVASALLLLAGGAAGGYFMGAGKIENQPAEESETSPGETSRAEIPEGSVLGPMVNIESFIVNILDEQGTRYLKAAISLETDKPSAAEELRKRMPQIKDAVLLLVGNKTFSELGDLQGKLQLRAELISRLNEILSSGRVRQIYFTDFVVQ